MNKEKSDLEKKIAAYVVVLILGLVLFSLGVSGILDSFWSGCGGALVAVAAMRLYSYYKFMTDAEYAKKVTTETHDERNNYLGTKAAALAFRWGLVAIAVLVFALQIAGLREYSTVLGFVICFLLIVYVGIYYYLKKKY